MLNNLIPEDSFARKLPKIAPYILLPYVVSLSYNNCSQEKPLEFASHFIVFSSVLTAALDAFICQHKKFKALERVSVAPNRRGASVLCGYLEYALHYSAFLADYCALYLCVRNGYLTINPAKDMPSYLQ